jgi:hypothetical protein
VDTLTYITANDGYGILQVHPVPFRDYVHINIPGDYRCTMMGIYDNKGVLIYSFNLHQNPGDLQDLELDLRALAAGMYFLRCEGIRDGQENVEMRKILKTD